MNTTLVPKVLLRGTSMLEVEKNIGILHGGCKYWADFLRGFAMAKIIYFDKPKFIVPH